MRKLSRTLFVYSLLSVALIQSMFPYVTGHFSFWSQPDSHGKSTIKEFIEQCVNNSRNGRFLYFIRPSGPGSPPMPIHLLHPVSRYSPFRATVKKEFLK